MMSLPSRLTSTGYPSWQRRHRMKSSARPELPTVMDCSALLSTRPDSTYKSGKVVQTNGATSYNSHRNDLRLPVLETLTSLLVSVYRTQLMGTEHTRSRVIGHYILQHMLQLLVIDQHHRRQGLTAQCHYQRFWCFQRLLQQFPAPFFTRVYFSTQVVVIIKRPDTSSPHSPAEFANTPCRTFDPSPSRKATI